MYEIKSIDNYFKKFIIKHVLNVFENEVANWINLIIPKIN